jgi:4-amino-4-deoxy-L-arabinose transferase-like glycosyltransferase
MTSERLSLKDFALLALMAILFFAPGISRLPPIDRDEGRYIQATTQMLESRDFVDIRFMDQPRYKQPVGVYWMQSAFVSVFGDYHAHKVWAHRLPSVINAMIAVLLAAWIATVFFGRKAGLAAGLMLAACFSLNFEARIAKTDATLCMIIMALQACLVRMRLDEQAGKPAGWRVASLFWALMGVGVMIKGPVPLMVSGGTLAMLAIWERSWGMVRRLRAFPLIGITLTICLPWLIAIGIRSHGLFYGLAVGKNFLGKVASGQESHGSLPGYHLALVSAMFWPSVLFVVTAIPAIWKHRQDSRVRFLLCWLAPTWIMFELVATKLPHYVLPTYGALAALAAGVWFGDLKIEGTRLTRSLGRVYAIIWAAVGIILAAASPVLLYVLQKATDPVSIGLAVVSAGLTVTTLVLLAGRKNIEGLIACALAAFVAWTNLFVWSGPQLQTIQFSPRIAAAVKTHAPCPTPVLATTPYQEASLAFLAGTQTRFIDAAAAADHLAANPACGLALIGADEYPAFAARAAADGLTLQKVDEIDGKNYSNSDKLKLGLFRATPAAGSSR